MKNRWRRWSPRLVGGCLMIGTMGIAPAGAQSLPQGPVVILPIAPVELTIPIVVPPLSGAGVGMRRDGLSWSRTGRADVDVDIDRHHGREVIP